eukprot:5787970-Amphidinium_carterae.1
MTSEVSEAGFGCDACGSSPIRGPRFECGTCKKASAHSGSPSSHQHSSLPCPYSESCQDAITQEMTHLQLVLQ